MNDWSMLKKLIWLHVISGGGSSGARTTVTGVSPLALANALAKPIRSLIQYGKVNTSNGEMYCNNGKLVAVDDELSVVGTPEVLTVGEQTATVENLLAVDDIKDEQNIISGTVTRRCEAVISDGTTPSGRYIGEVGEGNIIVKVRETGYEGDVATFEADRAEPLNGLTVNVEPIQAGSGDPSPDNVRPISGRTSATVTRTGRNLLNVTAYGGAFYNVPVGTNLAQENGVVVTQTNDGFDIVITTEWTGKVFATGLLPSGTYNLHFRADSTNIRLGFYVTDSNYVVTQYLGSANQSGASDKQITITGNGRIAVSVTSIWKETISIHDFQVEMGSAFTAYEPYQGNTYTIQLGDTVYGGTLDVTQGKMVVDRAIVDLGTLTWSRSGTDAAGVYRFSANIPTVIAERGSAIPRMLCSQYATVSPNKTYQRVNGVSNNLTIGQVMVYDDAYNNGDVATFRSAMSGVQLCYELATPFEITLTPTQIDTLLGTNNIWSDAGSVKAYVADGDLTEHVTAQPLRTVEGSNTVSVTSAVAPVQLEVKYVRGE